MTAGIYKIEFENGDTYIGQSSNIEERWRQHKYSKGLGSPLLQYAYAHQPEPKYTLIEETFDLNKREVFYIQLYQPKLNTRAGGGTMRGLDHPRAKYSKEQIEDIVYYYINTSLSYAEIERLTKVATSTVHDICKQRSHEWATEGIDKELLETARIARRPTYRLYDPKGIEYEFTDMFNFALDHDLSESTIQTVLRTGKNRHGWTSAPPDYYTLVTPDNEEFICTAFEANILLEEAGLSKYCRSQVITKNKPSMGFSMKKLDSTFTKL